MSQLTAKTVCIKGHATRGADIIKFFEEGGGVRSGFDGLAFNYYYFINDEGRLTCQDQPTDRTLITIDQMDELRKRIESRKVTGYKHKATGKVAQFKSESLNGSVLVGVVCKDPDSPSIEIFIRSWQLPDYEPLYAPAEPIPFPLGSKGRLFRWIEGRLEYKGCRDQWKEVAKHYVDQVNQSFFATGQNVCVESIMSNGEIFTRQDYSKLKAEMK